MSQFMLESEVKDMMTTGEVSKLTGIGKRTLQRYDEWGLISPERSEAGYMLFSEDDLTNVFLVKLFRDLGYTRNQIRASLEKPDFDVRESLDSRICELEAQLRKNKEQLLFAREMRRLLDSEDGPNTGEAICALLRHPEYAWVLNDEDGGEENVLSAYFKWAEEATGRVSSASPSELDSRIEQLIDESEAFGPSTRATIRMFMSLFDLEARGISASSEEARAVVAAAYCELENSVNEDPYAMFYMLGKYYQIGGMTPPSVMAQLDEKSMDQLAIAESYIGEALSSFVKTLEITEERRKEIEELES